MIGLIQRVSQASVSIEGELTSKIGFGILVLLGIEQEDNQQKADKLLDKILHYRIFEDIDNKMNLNILDIKGSLLVVSQFTLAANTKKGTRPSFSYAASPAEANYLYEYFVNTAKTTITTATGQFGANMQISLINDGPVTFWLQV